MSRKSAGKGRAVLGAVGLDAETIAMFYVNNPLNEEEAVHCGLLEWASGKARSHRPTTWEVLIGAMRHARIGVQDIDKLKEELQVRDIEL